MADEAKETFKFYSKQAEQGDAEAHYNLGLMYQKGQGVALDYEKAFQWFMKAAEQRKAEAYFQIARMYHEGQGVDKNYDEAIRYYSYAENEGDIDAKFYLGMMYHRGEGHPRNFPIAEGYISSAAKKGHVKAQFYLGFMYYKGRFSGYEDKMLYYFNEAANQGDADAKFYLGLVYKEGNYVSKNYEMAFDWFNNAAEQGHVEAQNSLGLMYQKGEGVEQSYVLAFQYFIKASIQGDAEAQYNVSNAYCRGHGVPKDFFKAYIWGSVAIINGNNEGKEELKNLEKELSFDDLGKAKKIAEKATESNYENLDEWEGIKKTKEEYGGLKKVEFSKILHILNYGVEGEVAIADMKKAFQFYSDSHSHSHSYYIDWLEHYVKNEGLEGNIEMEENFEIEFVKRMYNSVERGYKIVIKNLHFSESQYHEIPFHEEIFKYIIFRNNTFEYNSKDTNASSIGPKTSIHFKNYLGLKFENNKFEDLQISFEIPNQADKNFVILKDNIISSIRAPKHAPLFFEGRNTIGYLDIDNKDSKNKFSISWNPYQKIDTKGEHYILNKESFAVLKEAAIANNNKSQEIILNREIIKCDEHAINSESWKIAWQDKLIMLFGRLTSNHGISWIKPVIWLAGVNFVLTLIVMLIMESNQYDFSKMSIIYTFFHIFIEMFIPISNLSETIKIHNNIWILIIIIIQKSFFAAMVYEAIRVGRRFTAK